MESRIRITINPHHFSNTKRQMFELNTNNFHKKRKLLHENELVIHSKQDHPNIQTKQQYKLITQHSTKTYQHKKRKLSQQQKDENKIEQSLITKTPKNKIHKEITPCKNKVAIPVRNSAKNILLAQTILQKEELLSDTIMGIAIKLLREMANRETFISSSYITEYLNQNEGTEWANIGRTFYK